jgi:hypothetical protein
MISLLLKRINLLIKVKVQLYEFFIQLISLILIFTVFYITCLFFKRELFFLLLHFFVFWLIGLEPLPLFFIFFSLF